MEVAGYRNPEGACSAGCDRQPLTVNPISRGGLRSSIGECCPRNRGTPPSKDRGSASVQSSGAAQKFLHPVRPDAGKRHSNPERENRGWSWDDQTPVILHGSASAALRHNQGKTDG